MNYSTGLEKAKNATAFSDGKIKVGAVLVYKNKIISVGWNTSKSHPLQKEYNKYRSNSERYFDVDKHDNGLHAEMMCIIRAIKECGEDLSKCTLFIYSETKDGVPRLAKPCGACQKMIDRVGIKKVYFSC